MTSINSIINKSKSFLSGDLVRYFSLFSLITFALYAASLTYSYFIFDDYINITGNPRIPPTGIQDFLFYWADSNTPLAYNIWQFFSLFVNNDTAIGFRLINILIHALNTVIVFYIFRKLWPQNVRLDNPLSHSMFAALIFCLHPTHVESLVWVSNSRGVIATFFFLLALWRYLDIRPRQISFDIATFLLFVAACLTKPSAIVFPAFVFFIERHVYRSNAKQAFLSLHFYIYPVLGLAFIHIKDLINLNFYNIPILYRLINSLQALQHYFVKTILPFNLKFNYQLGPYNLLEKGIETLPLILTLLVSSIFPYFLFRAFFSKTVQAFEFFTVLFFIAVFPTLGFFPFDFQNISTVSDRYHYLAIVPFCWFLAIFIKRKSIQITLLVLFSLLSFNRVIEWSSQEYILTDGQNLSKLDKKMLAPLTRVLKSQRKCEEIFDLQFEVENKFFFGTGGYLWPLYSCIDETANHKLARKQARHHTPQVSDTELTELIAEVYLSAGLIDQFYYQANLLIPNSSQAKNKALKLIERARKNWGLTTQELYIQLHDQYLIQNEPEKSKRFINANRELFTGPLSGLEEKLRQKRENYVLFHKAP